MEFCTAISCMGGRVQIPVFNCLKKRFKVDFADAVSEPGPSKMPAAVPPSLPGIE